MKKFETDCDMGSIKVYNKGMACFFRNGIGDLPTTVYIRDGEINMAEIAELPHDASKAQFLEHFTVKDKAYLSEYDCDDIPIYTFSKGRWFVYLFEEAILLIEKTEDGGLNA